MLLKLTKCYDIVTEESAVDGESAESGIAYEGLDTVKDCIRALRDCYELSLSPVRSAAQLTGHEWASTEPQQDYHTGAYASETVHVARADGSPLKPHQLYRLFKAAGLLSPRWAR